MSDQQSVKQPTCGRMVHFFPLPNADGHYINFGGKIKLPAMVHDDDTYPTLTVFTEDELVPCVVVKTVAHKSRPVEEQRTAGGYWDWPEIK